MNSTAATMNTDKVSDYFAPNKYMAKTEVSVPTFYLDSLQDRLPITLPPGAFSKPQICPEMYDLAACLIYRFNRFDIHEEQLKQILGTVLIFLPGRDEIEKMVEILQNQMSKDLIEEWIVYPLHSSITNEEQSKIFQQPPKGARKIFVTTSLAESNMTVPDVKYVLDFCLTKIQVFEPKMYKFTDCSHCANVSKTSWISKYQGKRREGRVGRGLPGRVYKLVPECLYKTFPEKD